MSIFTVKYVIVLFLISIEMTQKLRIQFIDDAQLEW